MTGSTPTDGGFGQYCLKNSNYVSVPLVASPTTCFYQAAGGECRPQTAARSAAADPSMSVVCVTVV